MVSIHAERTFERLRYSLGRRPPQSNCPPNNVPRLASKPQVRIPALQEWYPKVDSTQADACASQSPTYPVREITKKIICYSKEPWGGFPVWSRATASPPLPLCLGAGGAGPALIVPPFRGGGTPPPGEPPTPLRFFFSCPLRCLPPPSPPLPPPLAPPRARPPPPPPLFYF